MAQSIAGNHLILQDASNVMGGGRAKQNAKGWLLFESILSRFCTGGSHQANTHFARGKPVFQEGRFVGRIIDLSEDIRGLKLDRSLQTGAEGIFEVRAFMIGDDLVIPSRLEWSAPHIHFSPD